MSSKDSVNPKVFISYSHDSKKHMDDVLQLSNRLRSMGIDCYIDQYEQSPSEGWPRWMVNNISTADFVIVVGSKEYELRFKGSEQLGQGLGAKWEGAIITQELYEAEANTNKFIPVLFSPYNKDHIPIILRGFTYFKVDSKEDFKSLYRKLTNQPQVLKPNLGEITPMQPLNRIQDFTKTWKMPYPRSIFFTGRDKIINKINDVLLSNGSTIISQPQVISGLGGIGKTQTAVEYVYRYSYKYMHIFWVRGDSRESLVSDFFAISNLLDMSVTKTDEKDETINAVKSWLDENTDWLLVFDNADDLHLIEDFLPPRPKGHIILTSRARVFDSIGITNVVELDKMIPEEAKEFLIKRTYSKIINSKENESIEKLAEELGFLPLALEQAGAYILRKQCTFENYLSSYLKYGLDLLEKSKPAHGKYPHSVLTTWSINFEQVELESIASADLLRLSAFFNPEMIPIECISCRADILGSNLSKALKNSCDPLVIDEIIEPLTQYSLVKRNLESNTYDIHRLVQMVIKENMDKSNQIKWVKRVIVVLENVFPGIDYSDWQLCEFLLPHVQTSFKYIKSYELHFEEAGRLLFRAGSYLSKRGRYSEALEIIKLSLVIGENAFGIDSTFYLYCLGNFAHLKNVLGEYSASEKLFQKILKNPQFQLITDYEYKSSVLNNLGELYRAQSKFNEAESFYKQALKIAEENFEEEPLRVALILNNLGDTYRGRGRYAEASEVCKKSIEIKEEVLGSNHPDLIASFNNLALIYSVQEDYLEAEKYQKRAIKICKESFGPDYHYLATLYVNLATHLSPQGNFAEAESLHKRALRICEKTVGTEHPDTATTLNSLGSFYLNQGKSEEAIPIIEKALAIRKNTLGNENPYTARSISTLSSAYSEQGNLDMAIDLQKQARYIFQRTLGAKHPEVARSLSKLAILYIKKNKIKTAFPLIKKAISIQKKFFGLEHTEVAESLNILGGCYENNGQDKKALSQYKKAYEIFNKILGPYHPSMESVILNYAGMLTKFNQKDEAMKISRPLHKNQS